MAFSGTREDIEAVTHAWERALAEHDVDALLACYAPDAVLESQVPREEAEHRDRLLDVTEQIMRILLNALGSHHSDHEKFGNQFKELIPGAQARLAAARPQVDIAGDIGEMYRQVLRAYLSWHWPRDQGAAAFYLLLVQPIMESMLLYDHYDPWHQDAHFAVKAQWEGGPDLGDREAYESLKLWSVAELAYRIALFEVSGSWEIPFPDKGDEVE